MSCLKHVAFAPEFRAGAGESEFRDDDWGGGVGGGSVFPQALLSLTPLVILQQKTP